MFTPKLSLLFTASTLASSLFAQTTWTGNADTNWDNAANWTDGSPNFGGTAIFSGPVTANQPDILGVNQTGQGIDFQSAGWTISDSVGGAVIRVDEFLAINSAGAGVNRLSTGVSGSGGGSVTMDIGSGNTLVYDGPNWTNGNPKIFPGSGTFVYEGAASTAIQNWSFTGATTLLINTQWGTNSSTLDNGATLGGVGTVYVQNYQTVTLGGTSTLAPGGNGDFGSEIGTLTFQSSSATNRAELLLDTGSTSVMQIGAGGVGDNDKVTLDLNTNGNLAIASGATLNITGTAIEDGTYTLFENTGDSSSIVGTFDTVLFNGSPINPANFNVNYGTDSITVDVTGVIPEPSTYALISGLIIGGTLLLRRRR